VELRHLTNFSPADPLYKETLMFFHGYLTSYITHFTHHLSCRPLKCFNLYVDYQLFTRQMNRSFILPPDRFVFEVHEYYKFKWGLLVGPLEYRDGRLVAVAALPDLDITEKVFVNIKLRYDGSSL